MAQKWAQLDVENRFGGTPDPEPKEQVRRAMTPEVGCDFFDLLREEYTDDETVELTMWICCVTGSQMFGAILQLEEASPRDQALLAAVASSRASAS